MKKVIVGRPINGISLNGLEYILDDEGEICYFDSIDEAKTFLREHGYNDEDIEEYLVFKESEDRTCFRCGSPLFKSDIKGYDYQCFHCDEDFFSFEQEGRFELKKMTFTEVAEKLWAKKDLPRYGFDFYCNYNPETGEKEWAYKAAVVRFADAQMVLINYYGGGAGFVYDIDEDGDPSGLAGCLRKYFIHQGLGESVWVEEAQDGE